MPEEDMRQQLELRLRGELLRDWCRQMASGSASVEFDDGWCSGQRTIRFCTSVIDRLAGEWRGSGDCWGLGRLAFYQIENNADGVRLVLALSRKNMPSDTVKRVSAVFPSVEWDTAVSGAGQCVIQSWDLLQGTGKANEAVDALESAWRGQVVPFEEECASRMHNVEEAVESTLFEGAELAVISDRFERNKKARELCIAAHGAVCAVCGFDSAKVYGPQFAGIIDVHHRVPLSEIREDHVVDPVRDLVPLCPNCHRAIHSKPGGGVYSIDELRAMMANGTRTIESNS